MRARHRPGGASGSAVNRLTSLPQHKVAAGNVDDRPGTRWNARGSRGCVESRRVKSAVRAESGGERGVHAARTKSDGAALRSPAWSAQATAAAAALVARRLGDGDKADLVIGLVLEDAARVGGVDDVPLNALAMRPIEHGLRLVCELCHHAAPLVPRVLGSRDKKIAVRGYLVGLLLGLLSLVGWPCFC